MGVICSDILGVLVFCLCDEIVWGFFWGYSSLISLSKLIANIKTTSSSNQTPQIDRKHSSIVECSSLIVDGLHVEHLWVLSWFRPTVSMCDGSSSLSVSNNDSVLGVDCGGKRVDKLSCSGARHSKVTCALKAYCSRTNYAFSLDCSNTTNLKGRKNVLFEVKLRVFANLRIFE